MNENVASLAKKMNDLFLSGNFVRKSCAGVTYHVPFSRRMQFIQPGRRTNDNRLYLQTPRGYLVRVDGTRLAA